MKNYSILIFISFILFVYCDNDKNTLRDNGHGNYDISNIDSSLTVSVDPRIELISVIQHFTSWASIGHSRATYQYKNDVHTYFQNYSNHGAIQKSEQLTTRGFNFSAPLQFVLHPLQNYL